MTFFLLCMIPIAATLGFVACGLMQISAEADRQSAAYWAQHDRDLHKEEDG